MFSNDRTIIRFNENSIDIAVVSRKFNKLTLRKFKSISIASDGGSGKFNTDDNIKEVKSFLGNQGSVYKRAIALLTLEGIITRLVECPNMNKKDLEDFIGNNIGEYFTLNMDDYVYDYKVLERYGGKEGKLTLFLVVFPKDRLKDIKDLMKGCGFSIERISIYPECILSIFNARDKNAAIFDINRDRSSITILESGKIFLYSKLPVELDDEERNFSELIDSMGYFLNFFSTRHFGSRVDELYVIGELSGDEYLNKAVKEHFGIYNGYDIHHKNIELMDIGKSNEAMYYDIFGAVINTKEIYNKSIDFNKAQKQLEGNGVKGSRVLKLALLSIVVLTIMWNIFNILFLKYQHRHYDNAVLSQQIAELEPAAEEYDDLLKQKQDYQKKEKYLEKIEGDKLNYTAYLEALSKGLPDNVAVRKVTLDREKIELTVGINHSTLDKANLAQAINSMGLFERVEIDTIKLDDTETEANFTLKVKKP